MPLLDHFHPPLSEQRHWDGFHSAWANAIVQQLNESLLPDRYFAEPHVRWGGAIEVDVASPPAAAIRSPVDCVDQDVVEVRIFNEEAGPTLVAAIELISPGNKDRPASRRAFVTKCAAYLQAGVCVALIDVVTTRQENLHAQLLELMGLTSESTGVFFKLYAVTYRTTPGSNRNWLEAWPEALSVGATLPALPLWLAKELAVQLDLEESYANTCRILRIGEHTTS